MVPVYILHARVHPHLAVKQNADRAICGDCPLRGNACYVDISSAPNEVFKRYHRGNYQRDESLSTIQGKPVRLGAYGDPCALPFDLVQSICAIADSWTGYTHQWRTPKFQPFLQFLMASCESVSDLQEAWALGWRTFRIRLPGQSAIDNEIVCPASQERGRIATCSSCGICSGTKGTGHHDVCVNIHGPHNKVTAYKNRIALTIA